MEESSPMKDSESPVSHSENNDQSHSVSPERPAIDSENLSSPVLNENNVENRLLNTEENVEIEDRPNRENVPDGFTEADEAVFQRHMSLSAALDSRENESHFLCKLPGCTFASSNMELYLKHLDTHDGEESMLCDMRNSRYAAHRRHRLLHFGVNPLECQVCYRKFFRKDDLMDHLLKHPKKRSYRCPFCSKSFAVRPHLKTHLSTEHTTVVIDKDCRLCDFTASSPNGAKIHFAMCHFKQSVDVSDTDERSQDNMGSSRTCVNPTENGAIDLAAVSQNFSFIQAAQFSPYGPPTSDSSSVVPGPSDLSRTSKTHVTPTVPGPNPLLPQTVKHNVLPVPDEDNRQACVSALAGSTTMVSPVTCQDRSCCRPTPVSDLPVRDRICVKPEPPELTVDDSQNSSVQPTSTMDLSASDVVETTCVINEASASVEAPCRRKIHKHSSGDDSGPGNRASPPNRTRDSSKSHISRAAHTCYRFRPCEESNLRWKSFPRHTCLSHQPSEKRTRLSENDSEKNVQNEHSDCEERKVFYNRATSTNAFTQSEIPVPSIIHHTSSLHNDGTCASEPQPESSCYSRKSTIVIRDIESCTLTCPYCGITFPDQTLYLLHRSLHSESSPWKCNLCGKSCKDKYDFNSHLITKGHY